VRWSEFSADSPDLADDGRTSTVWDLRSWQPLAPTAARAYTRMCPLLTDSDLFAFIVPSPKRRDLHRDGRYALHSFAAEANEDAF